MAAPVHKLCSLRVVAKLLAIASLPHAWGIQFAAMAQGAPKPSLAAPRSRMLHASLPAVSSLVAASTLPTMLGFWKSEYGVSYAYGSAMALSGGLYIRTACTPLAIAHAACLVLYGVRLNCFLLHRELFIPRFVEFREKIEQRAVDRGSRLARTPFVLSCSFLYFCMAAPLRLTAGLAPPRGAFAASCWALVGLMYAGFGIAAVGDLTKTRVKAMRGQNTLVTQGVFRWLRHPNYTGELLLWTANAALAGLCALAGTGQGRFFKSGCSAASAVGAAGIAFVLMSATRNLEKKQAETYGQQREYKEWVATSWSGPMLK
jgi:steroid 5-alpha reductase family enzyme